MHSDWEHMAVFIQQSPQRIHIGGPLPHQTFSTSEHRSTGLLLNRLRLNKTHLWLAGCDDNRLRIGGIVLLALNERPDILRCDKPHFVTKCRHLTRPIMGTTTGFKDNTTWFLLRHKRYELLTAQLLTKNYLSGSHSSVDLQNPLCQIDPNYSIVHLAVLSFA